MLQNQKRYTILSLGSDHRVEFQNNDFVEFCEKNGINHNFSTPRIPQQNGIVERKNRYLKEMARIVLNESPFPKSFWVHAIKTIRYIMSRALIKPILNKSPYELFFG